MDEEDEHFLSASNRKCILLSGIECHIINYLLTELARAIPGNIGPRSFLYGPRCARSVLSRPRAIRDLKIQDGSKDDGRQEVGFPQERMRIRDFLCLHGLRDAVVHR